MAKLNVIHGHVSTHIFEDDGQFPNNSKFPALIYKGALHLQPGDVPDVILELSLQNGWIKGWKDGVFDYHHYHSITHEVLGIYSGTADIMLGGPEGTCVELSRGDVLITPAGVAHKNMKSTDDFLCVGAYPDGNDYDMNYGREEERNDAIRNIASVEIPNSDPVFGSGPLNDHWKI